MTNVFQYVRIILKIIIFIYNTLIIWLLYDNHKVLSRYFKVDPRAQAADSWFSYQLGVFPPASPPPLSGGQEKYTKFVIGILFERRNPNMENLNLSEVGRQVNILVMPDDYDKLRYLAYKHQTNIAEILRNLISKIPDERPEPRE